MTACIITDFSLINQIYLRGEESIISTLEIGKKGTARWCDFLRVTRSLDKQRWEFIMRLRGRYKPNILMADSRSSGKSSEEINPESATFGFNYQLFFSSFEESNIIHSQYPRSGQKKKASKCQKCDCGAEYGGVSKLASTVLTYCFLWPRWTPACAMDPWTLASWEAETHFCFMSFEIGFCIERPCSVNLANPTFHLIWDERTQQHFFT